MFRKALNSLMPTALLRSTFGLFTALLLILIPLTSASTHAAPVKQRSPGCNSMNAFVIIWHDNGQEWDDCTWGYVAPDLNHVTEVETNGNVESAVWFKWYNGSIGKYCNMQGDYAHWSAPLGAPTLVTQVSYGTGPGNYYPQKC